MVRKEGIAHSRIASVLIERVRSSRGADVYKLRAQIASRLQSLIKELRLTVDSDTQRFEVVFRDGQGMILFVDCALRGMATGVSG